MQVVARGLYFYDEPLKKKKSRQLPAERFPPSPEKAAPARRFPPNSLESFKPSSFSLSHLFPLVRVIQRREKENLTCIWTKLRGEPKIFSVKGF
jgi:hypothetical protein